MEANLLQPDEIVGRSDQLWLDVNHLCRVRGTAGAEGTRGTFFPTLFRPPPPGHSLASRTAIKRSPESIGIE
jgi:hypothetical protein